MSPLPSLDIGQLTRAITASYANFTIATVNDHLVRVSERMTRHYFRHYYLNSDETFLVLEGVLILELETETVEV
ncbi:hypothetical protein [Fibrella forsythiae]|uniref:hypothetical protein n=1 Tax=Fibrella forsythiae TaxID=2817061 RepID=UPI001E4B9726|nr:hypothetical protein [Fibrella forsythiae]